MLRCRVHVPPLHPHPGFRAPEQGDEATSPKAFTQSTVRQAGTLSTVQSTSLTEAYSCQLFRGLTFWT